MEPNIQNTLTNLQIEPPQGSWELLSVRLNTEFDQAEQRVALKMDAAAIPPPPGIWSAISENLPGPIFTEEKTPAKIIAIPFWKVAVAAFVLIAISYGGWFLFRTPSGSIAAIDQQVPQTGNQTQAQPLVPSSSGTTRNIPPAIAQQLPETTTPLAAPPPDNNNTTIEGITSTDTETTNTIAENNQSDIPSTDPRLVRAEDVVTEAKIANRAYRDTSGRVVMDMNLLNTPGTQYVTVTAPNGEQTRISRKFLPVLTFINTGADNGQFNAVLKQKLQDLRRQLLQQASFVPSATNFLDIMELKELLQDK